MGVKPCRIDGCEKECYQPDDQEKRVFQIFTMQKACKKNYRLPKCMLHELHQDGTRGPEQQQLGILHTSQKSSEGIVRGSMVFNTMDRQLSLRRMAFDGRGGNLSNIFRRSTVVIDVGSVGKVSNLDSASPAKSTIVSSRQFMGN